MKCSTRQTEPKQETAPLVKPLEDACNVCGRVRWGEYQPLGFGKWRHRECAIGESGFRDAQAEKPESQRSQNLRYFERTD